MVLVVIVAPRGGTPLDPRSATPAGTRALAELLRARGIPVERVLRVPEPLPTANTGRAATVVVPFPGRLDSEDLDRLARSPGDVLLVAPDQAVVDALGLPLVRTEDVPVRTRPPGCALPAAVTAGASSTGGRTYTSDLPDQAGVSACYPTGFGAALAVVITGGRQVAVLGAGDALTNAHLDREGNAALGLGLLDRGRSVAWVLPTGAQASSATGTSALTDRLPLGLQWAILQGVLAVALLALARGRRLGPPVTEDLPVTVRAAETVEGRARLYRAARARGTAASALREGARARLSSRLIPGQGRPEPSALVTAVATRTGRDPVEVASLLYGPDDHPGRTGSTSGDADLVRLANDLETLDRQVRRT
jgi:hypothetical protein